MPRVVNDSVPTPMCKSVLRGTYQYTVYAVQVLYENIYIYMDIEGRMNNYGVGELLLEQRAGDSRLNHINSRHRARLCGWCNV